MQVVLRRSNATAAASSVGVARALLTVSPCHHHDTLRPFSDRSSMGTGGMDAPQTTASDDQQAPRCSPLLEALFPSSSRRDPAVGYGSLLEGHWDQFQASRRAAGAQLSNRRHLHRRKTLTSLLGAVDRDRRLSSLQQSSAAPTTGAAAAGDKEAQDAVPDMGQQGDADLHHAAPTSMLSLSDQEELVWYLEELPLMSSARLCRMMRLCLARGDKENAWELFVLWSGWTPAGAGTTSTLGGNDASVVQLSEDAAVNRRTFPFDSTVSMGAAQGGLLGAVPHAKSPLLPLLLSMLVEDIAEISGNKTAAVRHNHRASLLLTSFLKELVQPWWTHPHVPRETWSALQRFLLEVAAGTLAQQELKALRLHELVAVVERPVTVASATILPKTATAGHSEPPDTNGGVDGDAAVWRRYSNRMREVATCVQHSWVSRELFEDQRTSLWLLDEADRIGRTAFQVFARHELVQRRHISMRYFNACHPWARLAQALRSFSPTTTPHNEGVTRTWSQAAAAGGTWAASGAAETPSASCTAVFHTLWLLHECFRPISFTEDCEFYGKQHTLCTRLFGGGSSNEEGDAQWHRNHHHHHLNAVHGGTSQLITETYNAPLAASHTQERARLMRRELSACFFAPESQPASCSNPSSAVGTAVAPQRGEALHCAASEEGVIMPTLESEPLLVYNGEPIQEATAIAVFCIRLCLGEPTGDARVDHDHRNPAGRLHVAIYAALLEHLAAVGDVRVADSILVDLMPEGDDASAPLQSSIDPALARQAVLALGRCGEGRLATAIRRCCAIVRRSCSTTSATGADGGDRGGDAAVTPSVETSLRIYRLWRTVNPQFAEMALFSSLLWWERPAPGDANKHIDQSTLSTLPAWMRYFVHRGGGHGDKGAYGSNTPPETPMLRAVWEYLAIVVVARDEMALGVQDATATAMMREQVLSVMWWMLSGCRGSRDTWRDGRLAASDTGGCASSVDIGGDNDDNVRNIAFDVMLDALSSAVDQQPTNDDGGDDSPGHASVSEEVAAAASMLPELRRLLSTSVMGPQGDVSDVGSDCTLRRAVVTALVRRPTPAVGTGGDSSAVHFSHHVLERLLTCVVLLYWDDGALVDACVAWAEPHLVSTAAQLCLSSLCKQLMDRPKHEMSSTVERFLRNALQLVESDVASSPTPPHLSALKEKNYYVSLVVKQLSRKTSRAGVGRGGGGASSQQSPRRHAATKASTPQHPVVFPSLQVQRGAGTTCVRSSKDMRRFVPLPLHAVMHDAHWSTVRRSLRHGTGMVVPEDEPKSTTSCRVLASADPLEQ